MLEPPDVPSERIAACLREAYGLRAVEVTFLPIGADAGSAAYRVVTAEGGRYFAKLRRAFREIAVTLPRYLSDQGIAEIIPPLATTGGRLFAPLDPFVLIVYPFVDGRDGFDVALSPSQWMAFGAAIKRLHTMAFPPALIAAIPRETYAPRYRDSLRRALELIGRGVWADPAAAELAAFLRGRREKTADLVERAERYAAALLAAPRPFVVCHSDAHAGNLLIDTGGRLFIVDWDEPILAAKERDLMFVGGAQGFAGYTASEEERLFYGGYGPTEVDPVALTYYHYERIVVDLAIFCEQLLLTDEGGADRWQALRFVRANYDSEGTIATARRVERAAHLG